MHFDKLKQVELLNDQLGVLRDASEYVGKYFSIEYVRKVILGQTEEDIARIDAEIMNEIERDQIKSQDDLDWRSGEPMESFSIDGQYHSIEKDIVKINNKNTEE